MIDFLLWAWVVGHLIGLFFTVRKVIALKKLSRELGRAPEYVSESTRGQFGETLKNSKVDDSGRCCGPSTQLPKVNTGTPMPPVKPPRSSI